MADHLITQGTDLSMSTNTGQLVLAGVKAGEDLLAAAPCRIDTGDGLVYMAISSEAQADADPDYIGFTPRSYKSGAVVSLYKFSQFHYSDAGLTAGTVYFISDTKGRLTDTVPNLEPDKGAGHVDMVAQSPVAVAVSDSDIVVLR